MSNAMRQCHGLAGTGSRDNQQWPGRETAGPGRLTVGRSLPLRWIQYSQMVKSLLCEQHGSSS
jgi:hypothetical protein